MSGKAGIMAVVGVARILMFPGSIGSEDASIIAGISDSSGSS
jgi:hypothetical protein